MNRFVSLGLFLLLVVGGGAVIGMVTGPDDWYARLAKPAFNPPSWVFAPVWTCLYMLIAIAGWRISRGGKSERATLFWWAQLVLNFAWPVVFFNAHAIGAALVGILLLLIVLLGFITAAWNRDRIAAWMFVPYAAWVAFASLLNGTLFAMN